MRLSDYVPRMGESTATVEPEVDFKERLRAALYREVPSERIAQLVGMGRQRARAELSALIQQVMNKEGMGDVSAEQRQQALEETLDMILGLGPLEPLLADPSVTEITVNGPDAIFFERGGKMRPFSEKFASEEQLRMVADRIVAPLGRRVDEQQPIVNARLPEGHRVNVVIPPLAMDGTALTIRKFRKTVYSLMDMVAMGSMSMQIAQLLRWAVRNRCNIAVSGGTGSGKTTLLNALSQEIPGEERIITIEDSAELKFSHHPQLVRLEARMANSEGRGQVTIRELVINALRMRPDRIIVGECRGAEALDMLQAMNTGHDGSLTTLHAGSIAEVMARLVMMVRFGLDLPVQVIEAQIVSALDLIVQQDRMPDGSRRVVQIAVRDEDEDAAKPYRVVVEWDRRAKKYVWGAPPAWVRALDIKGIATEKEVAEWERSVQSFS